MIVYEVSVVRNRHVTVYLPTQGAACEYARKLSVGDDENHVAVTRVEWPKIGRHLLCKILSHGASGAGHESKREPVAVYAGGRKV